MPSTKRFIIVGIVILALYKYSTMRRKDKVNIIIYLNRKFKNLYFEQDEYIYIKSDPAASSPDFGNEIA
ncbi:MAG: hypothetical protein ABIP68_00035 [Ferruginibacter sp.]